MKELYLTVTDMTFLAEGRVLGRGRAVTSAPGPERPGDIPAALSGGALRMGVFHPAPGETLSGRWKARMEDQEGYFLDFRGDRFLLGYAPEAQTRKVKAGGR